MNILGAISALAFVFLLFGAAFKIIKWISRGNSRIEGILTGVFILWLIHPFFISTYPNYTNTIGTDHGSIILDPKKVSASVALHKWVKLPNYGYIYLKKIDNLDNKGLRLYYRSPGLKSYSPWGLKAPTQLTDTLGNSYNPGGGGTQAGLLLTSGVMDFVPQKNIGTQFILNIDGKNLRLY